MTQDKATRRHAATPQHVNSALVLYVIRRRRRVAPRTVHLHRQPRFAVQLPIPRVIGLSIALVPQELVLTIKLLRTAPLVAPRVPAFPALVGGVRRAMHSVQHKVLQ